MPCLVLLSGGMDSAVTFYDLLNRAAHGSPILCNTAVPVTGPVHAMAIYYGQRHASELSAARDVFESARQRYGKYLGLYFQQEARLPLSGSLLNSGMPVKTYDNSPTEKAAALDPSFVPYRNLLFFTMGAMWARELGAQIVGTGIRGGFPDCTEHFEQSAQELLRAADPEHGVALYSAVHMSRKSTLQWAHAIPGCWEALGHTITCFQGVRGGCGRCLPCHRRAEGFAELGMQDPAIPNFAAIGNNYPSG